MSKYYHYYNRQGKPIKGKDACLKWAKEFEKKDRIVKQQTTWLGFWVSTVFLGLNHNFMRTGKPILFETMAFPSDDQTRYSTEAEAVIGHKKMMRKWSNPLLVASTYISKAIRRVRRGY